MCMCVCVCVCVENQLISILKKEFIFVQKIVSRSGNFSLYILAFIDQSALSHN